MSHTLTHEESGELAALYALGALGGEERDAFERHLREGCESCAAELGGYRAVAEHLALAPRAEEPPPSVRERLLARVSGMARGGGSGGAAAVSSDFLVVRGGEGEWVETGDAGVFVKLLFVDKERDTVTTLVRMGAGARITRHRHLGVEQCLVLEGEVRSSGLKLRAGDFNCAMRGSVHDEIETDSGALLLLVSPESYEHLGRGAEQPHA